MPKLSSSPPSNLAKRLATSSTGITRKVIGRSLEGKEIEYLSCGNGPIKVFLIGYPHGNEPLGKGIIETVFKQKASPFPDYAQNVSLSAVTVASPDTADANLSTRTTKPTLPDWYFSNFELPINEQVEFSYALKGPCLRPESDAIATKLKQDLPDIVMVLHDEPTFSPTYVYLHDALGGGARRISSLIRKQGLPLLRTPYLRNLTTLSPGIFSLVRASDVGLKNTGRACTAEFARSLGIPLVVTPEIPHFTPTEEDGIADAPSTIDMLEKALAEALARFAKHPKKISALTNGELLSYKHGTYLLDSLNETDFAAAILQYQPKEMRQRALRAMGLILWAACCVLDRNNAGNRNFFACLRKKACLIHPFRPLHESETTEIGVAILRECISLVQRHKKVLPAHAFGERPGPITTPNTRHRQATQRQ